MKGKKTYVSNHSSLCGRFRRDDDVEIEDEIGETEQFDRRPDEGGSDDVIDEERAIVREKNTPGRAGRMKSPFTPVHSHPANAVVVPESLFTLEDPTKESFDTRQTQRR